VASSHASRAQGEEPMTHAEVLDGLWERRDQDAAVSDAVYRTIREAILLGRLVPGSRLGEEDLAKRFEVSRTPVREAVLRLEAEHLAERNSRRGLVVAGITSDEIVEVYAVRQALDGLAARLAAESGRPTAIAQLRWLNDQLRTTVASGSLAEQQQINLEFHEAMYKAGHNEFLLELIRTAHDRVRRFPGTTLSNAGRPEDVVKEHDEIIDAIEGRDGARAEEIASRHMGRAMEIRIQQNREMTRPGGPAP